jgi:hypothetical protein
VFFINPWIWLHLGPLIGLNDVSRLLCQRVHGLLRLVT